MTDVKTGRVRHEAEAGGDPLRLQIGAGIGDDFVGDPGERCDEQYLDDEAAPSRTATQRALQFGDKLRRWFSGFDGHRREPAGWRSADRRRVLDPTLVPERVEAARDTELGAGADVAVEAFAVIADRLHNPGDPILGKAKLFAEIAVDPEHPPHLRLV